MKSWAVIIPADDSGLYQMFVDQAKAWGLHELRVSDMLHLEFSAAAPIPEPLKWWEAKPLPFRVRAHVPCPLFNTSTQTIRTLSDGREMDVVARDLSRVADPLKGIFDLQVWTNLWVSHTDVDPL